MLDRLRIYGIASLALALACGFLASNASALPLTLEGLAGLTYTGESAGAEATGTLVFDPGASVDTVGPTSNPSLEALAGATITFSAALDPSTMPVGGPPWPHTRDGVLEASNVLPGIVLSISGSPVLAFDINYIAVSNATGFNDQVTLGSLDPLSFGLSEGTILTVANSPLASQVGGVGAEAIFHMVYRSVPGFAGTVAAPIWYDDFVSESSSSWSIKVLFAPEPGTGLLTGFGLLGLVAWARRARAQQ